MPDCAGDIVWSSGCEEAVSVHERVSVINFAEAVNHFIYREMWPLQLGAVLAPKHVGNKNAPKCSRYDQPVLASSAVAFRFPAKTGPRLHNLPSLFQCRTPAICPLGLGRDGMSKSSLNVLSIKGSSLLFAAD